MDRFPSSSKASLLNRLAEEGEGQLATHADTFQTHIPVRQQSFSQALFTFSKNISYLVTVHSY